MTTNSVLDKRLSERRRSTAKLVEIEGKMITLNRLEDAVSDGAGSMVRAGGIPIQLEPRKRVLFGLTQAGRGLNQQPERWFTTQTGEREQVILVLIGTYDDDIRKGDWWLDADEQVCRVIYVHKDKTYQVKAEVIVVEEGEGGSGA